MTDEELVELYQRGDDSALELLLEQKKGAVYTVVRKYYARKLPYIDQEDLIQEAYAAAIKAAQMFKVDLEKGTSFANYMMGTIDHKMLYIMRQGRKTIDDNKFSLNIKKYDDADETSVGDTISDKSNHYDSIEESIYHQEIRRDLEEVMKQELTLMQRQVIKYKVGWNGTPLPNTTIKECLNIGEPKVNELNYLGLSILKKNEKVQEIAKEYYGEVYKRIEETFKAIELENLKNKWMV